MTATDIWEKEWFMKLEPRLKCLVRFIWDHCDNAGVWSPNWTLARMMIGAPVSIDDIKKIDGGKRHEILSNGKIWILDFIKFQCGSTLNEKSPPHNKVINLLKEHRLIDRVLNRVSNTLKEEEEEKEEVKNKEVKTEKEKKEKEKIVFPFDSERFILLWKNWIEYKSKEFKFQFKSLQSEQAALTKLSNLAKDENEAVAIITESMAQGWKGFFKLETQKNETNKAQTVATGILKNRGFQ